MPTLLITETSHRANRIVGAVADDRVPTALADFVQPFFLRLAESSAVLPFQLERDAAAVGFGWRRVKNETISDASTKPKLFEAPSQLW